MQSKTLISSEILGGYDAVCTLYSYVPPLSHWRAWEYAAYRHYELKGRILDLGCGDGRYFSLIWPLATDVVGVDLDPEVAELGRQSGIYKDVHVVPAQQIPEADGSFDHVFANCSLEHMDRLDDVLAEVFRCLKPGGNLLCSVVTDRFVEWALLPKLVARAGFGAAAASLQKDFLDFHHLVNPLSVDAWVRSFERAGLVAEEYIPILPKHSSGIFLLMDNLWHIKRAGGGEMGDDIFPFLSVNSKFPGGFRKVLEGILDMELNWRDCSGAVFLVRKPG
ncbi:class I SAM-dependent methyltransferase [Methylomonas montana]|uniref:class I SAM-dependent methyltransferase n=1 Tax=Methylomonas montana TaxID=3058963 RepID=UPI00265B1900|nr:class I SAM-dependent methyltransferase [Methylomonas montana]WKJ92010.1 class I SAM-dependent methyltransferase [Methylomonas montana]